jgi:GT2 family glycosyltransferase
MALLAMCIYCTETNERAKYAMQSLESLATTVDFDKHRLILIINSSNDQIEGHINWAKKELKATTIRPKENIGTARGINLALAMRLPGEYCIKADEDVVWEQAGWVDEMESVLNRDNTIGIVGAKRKDIDFDPNHENPAYRSQLVMLPHQPGETWITVEKGPQIMGTCTMFNWRLLDKVGFLKQPSPYYSLEDTLISLRSELAGFWNCYLPHIKINHIDDGANPYTQVKHQQAADSWPEYMKLHEAYCNGTRSIYEEI